MSEENGRDWNDEHCSKCAKTFEDCVCPIPKITVCTGPEYKAAIAFIRRLPLQKLQTKDFTLALVKDAGLAGPTEEIEKMDQPAWEDFLVNNVY